MVLLVSLVSLVSLVLVSVFASVCTVGFTVGFGLLVAAQEVRVVSFFSVFTFFTFFSLIFFRLGFGLVSFFSLGCLSGLPVLVYDFLLE